MARRERNQGGRQGDETRGPSGPSRGGRPAAPAKAPAPAARRGPMHEPPRPRSVAEDPNAYRSPGFQDVDQNPYKIDYAGLPRDVEEEEAELAAGGDAPSAPTPAAPPRAPNLPRGMLGRNQDRRGTDPNAYRSPAFQDLDQLHQRFGARRGGPRPARGPQFPEGAPRDVEETEEAVEATAPEALPSE